MSGMYGAVLGQHLSMYSLGFSGCDNCETEKATSRCVECDEKFCEACFQTLHKTAKKKVHQKESIEEAETAQGKVVM